MTDTIFQEIDFKDFESLVASRDFNNKTAQKIVQQLWEACSEQGFFYIRNHGIEQELIEKMFSIGRSFFSLPSEDKLKFRATKNIGYSQPGNEKLSHDLTDFKESFNFKKDLTEMKDIPAVCEEERATIESFSKKAWDLTRTIMTGLSLSLDQQPDYFNKAHNFENVSGSIFRLLHYPPVSDKIDKEKMIRAGSHSDYGTITLLFQENQQNENTSVSGLQVLMKDKNNDGDNIWEDVPSKKGCIVVNIADLLSFWTEGRLRSAIHRVVFPEGDKALKSRYSMAYFVHPDSDYVIETIESRVPAPFPAAKTETGVLKASFGESEFFYGESGDKYLMRRLNSTYQ